MSSIQPEKWYSVCEVSGITGWSVDTVRRWVYRGLLKAFVQPTMSSRRKRVYRAMRILGRDLLDFMGGHMA